MEEVIQLEDEQVVGMTVSLFIKKLWNMVNDSGAEDIISWNCTGDSFIIHDQFQLTTKLLPHYFKHNNMASFVRQLNFYNFRKVQTSKNHIQFAHSCFIRDVPQILVFIKRKHSLTPKQNSSANVSGQVNNLLDDLKEMKIKHSQIDKEMSLLKQDSLSLWNELNSLRMKYAKQSSVINKLIHFLITYIHKHQTSFSKQNIRVSRNVNPSKLLELDYLNPKEGPKNGKTESYSVLQPGCSKTITYSLKIPDSRLESNGKTIFSRDALPKKSTQSLKQILAMNEPRHQTEKDPTKNSQGGGITYSVKLPGNQTRDIAQSDIQNSLLEILEENEKMSVENSLEEMMTEIQTDDVELIDGTDNEPIVQSPPAEDSNSVDAKSMKMHSFVIPETNYVVEYPDQSAVNMTNESGEVNCQNLKSIPVCTLGKKSNIYVSKTSSNSTNNFIPETSYSNPARIPEKKKMSLMYDDSQCPPKKPKISSTTNSSTPLKIAGNQSKEMVQPEIQEPLLEILGENRTLSTEIPLENLFSEISEENLIPEPAITNQVKSTVDQVPETYPIVESPSDEMSSNNYSVAIPQSNIMEISENDITGFPYIDLEPIVQSPSDGTAASLNVPTDLTKYSILENPKQNLSLYLDNTQEELNMLQEILNNLNSKDFENSANLNSSFEAICSAEDNENEIDNIINKSPSNIAEIDSSNDYNLATTTNISVDEFFNDQFMNSDL